MIANIRQWELEVEVSRQQSDSKLPPMGIRGRGFVLDCLIVIAAIAAITIAAIQSAIVIAAIVIASVTFWPIDFIHP